VYQKPPKPVPQSVATLSYGAINFEFGGVGSPLLLGYQADLCVSRKLWRSPYCMYSKIISGALSSLVSAELIPVSTR